MRSLDTYYNGYFFRSRLEARWAVFFDACGVKWEYEAQGYELEKGIYYLPDFILHDVTFNHAGYSTGNDLYVEVKGEMSEEDAKKIELFSMEKPILVVNDIPNGETTHMLCESMSAAGYHACHGISLYNFETVDGDYFQAYPGVDLDGTFNLFGDDCSYLNTIDEKLTVSAYRRARCARFEHGDNIAKRIKNGDF